MPLWLRQMRKKKAAVEARSTFLPVAPGAPSTGVRAFAPGAAFSEALVEAARRRGVRLTSLLLVAKLHALLWEGALPGVLARGTGGLVDSQGSVPHGPRGPLVMCVVEERQRLK